MHTLQLQADSEQTAKQQALSQGYEVLSIKPSALFITQFLQTKIPFPLTLFSQELLALLEAGLTLNESIEVLAEKSQQAEIKQVLNTLLRLLSEGKSISAALSEVPSTFSALYIATLRAGEKTGGIAGALKRYIIYQAQVDVVKKKIISASIYPAVLFTVGGLVILFLLAYVVPQFSMVYEDAGSDLPFISQMLLIWGQFIHEHFIGFVFCFFIAIAGMIYLFQLNGVKAWLFKLICNIPTFGEHVHIYQLARFYRALGMLLMAGIPVTNALTMVADLLTQDLKNKLDQALVNIKAGQLISQAMQAQGLTTSVSSRMLRVGERSGQMGEMMEKIASFYDEENTRWLEWFTKLFEPILMLIMGGVIGLVVLMLYIPIFDLVGNL